MTLKEFLNNLTFEQTVVRAGIVLSLGIVMAGATIHVKQKIEVNVACAEEVSVQNWQIKSRITTSGEVSEDTIEKICEIIQTQVPDEAWNYLCNTGGKVVVVEGSDIKGYILENYVCEDAKKVEKNIHGYCPQFRDDMTNVLQKVDVVVASEHLDSLLHEFCHVVDYTNDYSRSWRFKKIYENADGGTIFTKEDDREYYMEKPSEFFAETARMYITGELNGVDAELEAYLSGILGD